MKSSSTASYNYKPFILTISILLPVIVALLYFLPAYTAPSAFDKLPLLNASINGTTFFILIFAWIAIVKGKRDLHKKLMLTAVGLSVLFLVSYVLYHSTHESTKFGGEGAIKSFYYFILLSHILLSVAIVPLVLITLVRALAAKFDKHKKLARITLPVWLYVTLTGVLVYLLISPYYP